MTNFRHFIALLALGLGAASATLTSTARAADQADEYPQLSRLTSNYEVNERTQNVDAVKLPVSVNKTVEIEGTVIRIGYGYLNETVNASHLQFGRHFESLARKLGGEVVYRGNTDELPLAATIRFPKGGRTVWALAATGDHQDIYHYQLTIVETATAWAERGPARKDD
jgi:hypothetical protein